jgi:hypothetical protein
MANVTSNFILREPRVSTAEALSGTVTRAETFLSRAKALYDGNLKAAPAKGSERAIRRKLDGSLNLSIHEGATILRHADDIEAVDLLRAFALDGGKHRIHITIDLPQSVNCRDLEALERDIYMGVSRFILDGDAAAHSILKTNPDLRRLRNEAIGIEARINAFVRVAAGEGDPA